MDTKIALIGTGGTIAGQGTSDTDLTGYTPGILSLQDIIADIPGIRDYGPYAATQFANIESSDITVYQWVKLAKTVQKCVDKDDIGAVVITHGTDSMEETAYFLHLTVHTDKPIIITGSMRPAGAISADGPLNLLQAVQVARTPESHGKGVLVVLNGYIDGARDVTKMNTINVATFGSPNTGHMGIVQDGVAHFYSVPVRKHTMDSEFGVEQDLPRVDILTCYAGIEEVMGLAILATNPAGLILTGLGHGTIPQVIRNITKNLSIPVVRASRTGSGIVSKVPQDEDAGYYVSDSLSPQKARILLMLALQKERTANDLERIFKEY